MYPTTIEQDLIDWIADSSGGNLIGDDCAVLPGGRLVTSDMLMEGTHFDSNLSLEDLGWKAIAVNLSDVAAMGGIPQHLMIDLAMPDGFGKPAFLRLYRSMIDCAQKFHCDIAGGDLTRGKLLTIAVTVLGNIHENGCLFRSGAKVGDVVVVTGDFGASAAGLWMLQNNQFGFEHCRQAHCHPFPKFTQAWSLVSHTGSRGALMDASDGLADALIQISKASSVGMEIDLSCLPMDEETRAVAKLAGVDPLTWALYGGEDYELVASLPADTWQNWSEINKSGFKAIGRVTKEQSIVVRYEERPYPSLNLNQTFQHWSKFS